MKALKKSLIYSACCAAFFSSAAIYADDDDEEDLPLSEAQLFFELNDTDGDLGIHGKADGDAWKRLRIESPNDRVLLDIKVKSRLKKQGLTELFFESAEPTFDELDPDKFFRRFPEGEYEIEAITLDGEELEGEVMLSHVIPAAPDGLMLSYAVDCDDDEEADDEGECEESEEVPPAEFERDDEGNSELVCMELEGVSEPEVTLSWEPVTMSHKEKGTTAPHGHYLGKAGEVNVHHYEVVIETETEDELEVVSSTLLPPDITSFEFPEEIMELSDEFKFEILIRDVNGNQSATEACFEIDD
ncbi:hypothetical protein [Thalassomonas actiniarum]|uniref:Uncharacterized protein n=1 Tax=Thalassomonas actiniarum TaxID=485447 RepID=A0AAE9YRC8_9GAMM|nr:hypothetical protein [Thalassomonas actiniarum]WDD99829.1 hypothetical protein SG35_003920 [Thalassomonas actiniarum]